MDDRGAVCSDASNGCRGVSLAVRMEGIDKRFGSVTALDDVSVHVERGAIHALVGENGAGKTTLMRILYGAHRPDSGKVMLNDREIQFSSTEEAISLGIGMVSQHYAI